MRIALAAYFLLLACAHNVPQDKRWQGEGAKTLEFDSGAVEERGIVTYPGGDRVDRKKIDLPEKQRGALDIELSWVTPRPGLKLSFDVFDGYNQQLISGKKITRAMRRAQIRDAHGTYFIRVYAVGRGDAGKYKLGIGFDGSRGRAGEADRGERSTEARRSTRRHADREVRPREVRLPELRLLRQVPADQSAGELAGLREDVHRQPAERRDSRVRCDHACPLGGDIRVKSCTRDKFKPCPDPKNPDPTNLNCLNFQYEPEVARIVKKQVIGNEVEVIIMIGAKSNVTNKWTGAVLQGTTSKALAGGKLTITNISLRAR